ncbi:DUF4258 domain-containing protein [Candidatus Pacearchaeota archaeon]|nr:DUF4258 domain-containing protein [Candidatus Pacearchaeota archaeon]MBI2057090.1 DUF4258 domain-containing protein [Candidatus Pacearchaeota archaeon]
MKIIFTEHAEKQIKERKIEKRLIEETIKYADKIRKAGKDKYYASKKVNGFSIEVVYVRENYIKVITVYPI